MWVLSEGRPRKTSQSEQKRGSGRIDDVDGLIYHLRNLLRKNLDKAQKEYEEILEHLY
jgi:hypothetical protein